MLAISLRLVAIAWRPICSAWQRAAGTASYPAARRRSPAASARRPHPEQHNHHPHPPAHPGAFPALLSCGQSGQTRPMLLSWCLLLAAAQASRTPNPTPAAWKAMLQAITHRLGVVSPRRRTWWPQAPGREFIRQGWERSGIILSTNPACHLLRQQRDASLAHGAARHGVHKDGAIILSLHPLIKENHRIAARSAPGDPIERLTQPQRRLGNDELVHLVMV